MNLTSFALRRGALITLILVFAYGPRRVQRQLGRERAG